MSSFRNLLRCSILVAASHALAISADTVLVLAGPKDPSALPAAALGAPDVGERHCNPARCVVLPSTAAHMNQLTALAKAGLIVYQAIDDADRLEFQNAAWDAASGAFVDWFPGNSELPAGSDGLFGVAFKSYVEPAWLKSLSQNGFTPVEPLPVMGYLVYGPRSNVAAITRLPHVKAMMEIPAGLKRQFVDIPSASDSGGAVGTTISFVDIPNSPARAWIVALNNGRLPALTYALGVIRAYTLMLTREQGLDISRYAEVVSVGRSPGPAVSSDERTNRIISGGPNQAPPWPETLEANDGYSETFVAGIRQAAGGQFNLDNQVIGFLDTAVPGPTDACPPYLDPDPNILNDCRVVFRADTTKEHYDNTTRAKEVQGHGSLTTAIAAGYPTQADSHGYSFTKGVAKGAKVAMVKTLRTGYGTCDLGDWRWDIGESAFCDGAGCDEQRVRYALVELGADSLLPDQDENHPFPPAYYPGGQRSPHATIINHSWNIPGTEGNMTTSRSSSMRPRATPGWFRSRS